MLDSFANAVGLWYPNLSFNRLCGALPQGGNMWRFNTEVFANNSCLFGSPLPPCFDSASAPIPLSASPFAFSPEEVPLQICIPLIKCTVFMLCCFHVPKIIMSLFIFLIIRKNEFSGCRGDYLLLNFVTYAK